MVAFMYVMWWEINHLNNKAIYINNIHCLLPFLDFSCAEKLGHDL